MAKWMNSANFDIIASVNYTPPMPVQFLSVFSDIPILISYMYTGNCQLLKFATTAMYLVSRSITVGRVCVAQYLLQAVTSQ